MKKVSESITVATNSQPLKGWCVSSRDGIFYATLAWDSEGTPLEVALHGVSSESEAQQACAAMAESREAATRALEYLN